MGIIVQVSVSGGGLPKRAVAEGFVATLGLRGDRHAHPKIHGGPLQAMLLIAAETVDDLKSRGYPVFYGAMGENLTTRDLDLRGLRIGDRVRAGAALLEITKPRGPCLQLDVYGPSIKQEIYDARVKARDAESPLWSLSGLYARVVEEGAVKEGDSIERASPSEGRDQR